MISERDIRDRIFKEFIAPTKVKKDYIGIEIEMPIINLNKKAVDFNVVHKVTNSFKNEFGDFKENGIDYETESVCGHLRIKIGEDTDTVWLRRRG